MRNPKRIIYTSSYDRGLEHLLKMWPDIRREVKDAELHVYYGWQLFLQFHKDNPGSMAWHKKMVELLTQEGVTDHGRVPQPVLDEEYKRSGIFAYPAHFGEINCISAIKAQAYGCIPVVIDYAALKETVQFGFKVEGDIYDEETQQKYKEMLIWALKLTNGEGGSVAEGKVYTPFNGKNGEGIEEYRKRMMEWAKKKYSWSVIASQWDKEFKGGDNHG